MARTGRPQKEINKGDFEKLCAMHCTEVEICNWFDTTDKTLNSWCMRTYKQTFSEVYKKKTAKGKASLRRMQWKAAENGDRTILIWLGKQYLNQRENIDIETGGHITIVNDIPRTDYNKSD